MALERDTREITEASETVDHKYFDHSKDVILQGDASESGLGAVTW